MRIIAVRGGQNGNCQTKVGMMNCLRSRKLLLLRLPPKLQNKEQTSQLHFGTRKQFGARFDAFCSTKFEEIYHLIQLQFMSLKTCVSAATALTQAKNHCWSFAQKTTQKCLLETVRYRYFSCFWAVLQMVLILELYFSRTLLIVFKSFKYLCWQLTN